MLTGQELTDLLDSSLDPAGPQPVAAVAARLGIGTNAVRLWATRGRVPHLRIRGRIFFLWEDIRASIKFGRQA